MHVQGRGSRHDLGDGHPKGDLRDTLTDKSRWISISTMLCEPLTKNGPTTSYARLCRAMSMGVMDLSHTVESQMKKLQQQEHRLGRIPSRDQASTSKGTE